MHPSIEVVEADPQDDARLLGALADWCERYTPLVATEGADGLFLDVTGCTHLFGGEQALLDDAMQRFRRQGFDARAGLASTPGAAWAAARFAGTAVLSPGEEENFMEALPLAALRLDAPVRASLESVGLRTVGAVATAPRAPLVRRFGKTLILRLDQALGRVEEPISPRLPLPALSVERRLAEAVLKSSDIEQLAGMLAASLAGELERRGEGARTLELALFRVDGVVSRLKAGASRPLRAPDRIGALFRERLAALRGDLDPGYGFDMARLSALLVAPLDPRQEDLAETGSDAQESLAAFADRVEARLGRGALRRPVGRASHIPERAVADVSFSEPAPDETGEPKHHIDARDRPIRLFRQPEPLEVMAEIPDGPPRHFRWRRALHRIARAEGPERIAPEWWCDPAWEPTRDYFRVEDESGRRYWIFRRGLYGASSAPPSWYIHGLFA